MLTALVMTVLVAQTCVDFPGATYTEAQPNGAVVALFPGSHLELNRERVEFAAPGLDPLYTRLSRSGARLAGQGHGDGQAWEFVAGTGWRALGPTCGVSPLAYRPDETLVISTQCEVGSQGYRYVDASGRAWTGDETYGDVRRGIFEYTECGGVTIGQGAFGGVLAIDEQGRRFLLEPGDTRFVRFNCEGSMLAFAVVKFAERKSRACWLTKGQLIGFPEYPDVPVEPEPEPEPDPEPQPEQSWLTDEQEARLKRIVEEERAKVDGQPSAAQLGAMLNTIALRGNALLGRALLGLSRKDGGNKCPMPAPAAVWIACDIIHFKDPNVPGVGQLYDVFVGADDGARPTWAKAEYHNRPDERPWVAPVLPTGTDPEPEPSNLEARVSGLEQQVAALGSALLLVGERVAIVERRSNGVPKDEVLSLIEAALIDLRVAGRSQSAGWGPLSHSHQIELRVVR